MLNQLLRFRSKLKFENTKLFCSQVELSPNDNKNKAYKISEITSNEVGNNLRVQGWVQNIRKMKKNFFFDIEDGSTCKKFQVIVPKTQATELAVGQSVSVHGVLQETPKKQLELLATDMKIIGDCNILDGKYPFTPKQTPSPEYVREHIHLRPHVSYMRSIFRIRHRTMKIIHDYMDENNFIQINAPVLTSNDCEGAGEVFQVKPDCIELLKSMAKADVPLEEGFFDKKAFLSVSGQLHLEAMSHGLGNTYTLGPAFRAENCKSPVHLSEFYMFEAELAFCDRIETLTEFIERMIKTVTKRVLDKCEEDISNCFEALGLTDTSPVYKFLENDFEHLEYGEALRLLAKNMQKLKTELDPENGLSKEQELFLVDLLQRPIFITNWPKSMKPFYMKSIDNDPFKVSAIDLLMPKVGELVGGSLREDNYDNLKESIEPGLEWYLDLRKYGNIPTGGFGLGFERYLQLITGVRNIRDVIHFPRYPHSCKM